MKYYFVIILLLAACGQVDTGVERYPRSRNNSAAPTATASLTEDSLELEFSLSIPPDSDPATFAPPQTLELGLFTCEGSLEQRANAELTDELAGGGGLGISYAYHAEFAPPPQGCLILEVLEPDSCGGSSEEFEVSIGTISQVMLEVMCTPPPPTGLNAAVVLERAAEVTSVDYLSILTATCVEQPLLTLELRGDHPTPPLSVATTPGLWTRVEQELEAIGGVFVRRAVIHASANDASEHAELTVFDDERTIFSAEFSILPQERAPLCLSAVDGEVNYLNGGTPVAACIAQCGRPLDPEAEAHRRVCEVPEFADQCASGDLRDFFPFCEVN